MELTGLGAPPMPEEIYTVRIVDPAQAGDVWVKSIPGRVFSKNYTLCLFLEPGALTPGEYDVNVIAGSGESVFHSTLLVE